MPLTRRRFFRTLAAAGLTSSFRARAQEPPSPLWSRAEPHMGCQWTLTLPDLSPDAAEKAAAAVFAEIARLNTVFSDYEPTSELNRLCARAGGDAPVPLSADLFDILDRSRRMAEFSGGLFDVTLAPCIRLWRRSRRRGELPDADALAKARALSGWQSMELDPAARTVRLAKPGMQLDLGGIAKGWTQDACLKLLLDRFQITGVLLDAAGEVALGTPPAGRLGWRVALQDPSGSTTERLLLRDANIATSGDHFQFVEIAGKRYSHIIDPRTGLGSTISRQASVIAPTGALADPLTKLLCLMEPAVSLAMVTARYPEAQARVTESLSGAPPSVHQTARFPAKEG
jgi:thiamine biosynthesis lipoprotein